KLELLPRAIAGYENLLARLKQAGVQWVQIDEPILALELDVAWVDAFAPAYSQLSRNAPSILLATYFDHVRRHADLLRTLPVYRVHLDLLRCAGQLHAFLANWPADRVLSARIVDGPNIWRADLESALATLQPLRQ